MTSTDDTPDLVTALAALRSELAAVVLRYEIDGVDEARADVAAVVDQVDDYLLPRLDRVDAPLLVVVGGSTGAGKSTLVNSLVRQEVTRAGVLRPTTRAPALVHHPDDVAWFDSQRILPSLARVHGPEEILAADAPVTTMRLVPSDTLPPGLALLDAPDIDSVVESNRVLAAQLLAAADLWLFVTTASRYADAVPWDFLREASERGAAVSIVLNRVPRQAMIEVRDDLATMLSDNGLGASAMFTVVEAALDGGLLPRRAVGPLNAWLSALASDDSARGVVIRRTVTGALNALVTRAGRIAVAADEQSAAASRLRQLARERYSVAVDRLDSSLSDGSVLRGEVLTRWQEVLGTGELWRSVESGVARARDRVVALFRARPAPSEQLGEALQSSTHALLLSEVTAAAGDVALQWRADRAGAVIMDEQPELAQPSPYVEKEIERLVRDWQGAVIELVRTEGEGKKSTARAVSLGVNGAGFVLMLVVFSSTAGLSGGEVGIAAGTAAVSQRLLEAILGDEAVRRLAARARSDLMQRVGHLIEGERRRWVDAAPVVDAGARIRTTLEVVETAR